MHHKIQVFHQPTLTAQYAIVRAIPIDVLPNGVVVHTEDLKIKGCAININTHDIMYITTFNKRKHNYLILRLYGKQHHCLIIRGTLDKIMESLPANMFYRSHSSYIININYVDWFLAPNKLFIATDILPVGKHFLNNIKEVLFPGKAIMSHKACSKHKKQSLPTAY